MEYFLEESLPDWQSESGGELGNAVSSRFSETKKRRHQPASSINHSSFSPSGYDLQTAC